MITKAPPVMFREMTSADLDTVTAIESAIQVFPWTKSMFADSLQAGHMAYVRIKENHIIGYSLYLLTKPEAELLNIGMAKAYQNQGFGREMLIYGLQQLQTQGVHKIFLEVRESNQQALCFYERFGFKRYGIRKKYYNHQENAILISFEFL